jgi:hypothetical protein
MHYLFLPEIRSILSQAGFTTLEELKWMDLADRPSLRDRDVVIVARRRRMEQAPPNPPSILGGTASGSPT